MMHACGRTAVISLAFLYTCQCLCPFDFLPAVLFFSFYPVGFPLQDSFFVPGLLLTSSYCHSLSRHVCSFIEKARQIRTLSPHPALHKFLYFVLQISGFPAALKQGNTISFRKMLLLIPEGRPRILLWLLHFFCLFLFFGSDLLCPHLLPASC